MKLRGSSCLITAAIMCFLCSSAVHAQVCLSGARLATATAWRPSKPVWFWGIRLVTVKFNYTGNPDFDPTPFELAVFKAAMNEWDEQACNTGILLVPYVGPSSGLGDLNFAKQIDEDFPFGCAAYWGAPFQVIFYGPNWQNRLSGPNSLGWTEAKAVILHEIGHFLGLDHTTFPATIMNQGTCSTPAAVTSLTNADGLTVAGCLIDFPQCNFNFPFGLPIEFCASSGGYWDFTNGACAPEPQPVPCVDCLYNDDCCYGDVCHNGQCGPPEENCPDCCPECPYDTVCYEGFCSYATPVLIDVNGDGFQLTDAAHGVNFDFSGNGAPRHMAWTAAGTDDAWLVWDKNRNGKIDSAREMFGNLTAQPRIALENRNGFLALAELDKPALGGNGDGVISRQDYFFRDLRLWTDSNHNGISEPSELKSLEQLGMETLELNYKESKRTDQFGNQFRYRAKVKDAHGAQIGRWAWDVTLKLN